MPFDVSSNYCIAVGRSTFMWDRLRMTFLIIHTCITHVPLQEFGEMLIKSNPKMRQQTNLRVLIHCFASSLHPRACAHVASTWPSKRTFLF